MLPFLARVPWVPVGLAAGALLISVLWARGSYYASHYAAAVKAVDTAVDVNHTNAIITGQRAAQLAHADVVDTGTLKALAQFTYHIEAIQRKAADAKSTDDGSVSPVLRTVIDSLPGSPASGDAASAGDADVRSGAPAGMPGAAGKARSASHSKGRRS